MDEYSKPKPPLLLMSWMMSKGLHLSPKVASKSPKQLMQKMKQVAY